MHFHQIIKYDDLIKKVIKLLFPLLKKKKVATSKNSK